MQMGSYTRVRRDSVIGFMPRFAAHEHLPLRLSRFQSRRFLGSVLGVLGGQQMRIK